MNFSISKTFIPDLLILESRQFADSRGCFMETFNKDAFSQSGIESVFVQDNQSISKKGTIRGLHFQKNYPQAKLVRVVKGEIFDVVVDIRPNSVTFGKWFGAFLTADNQQILVPTGCAHGFLAITNSIVIYKCSDVYHPEDENGIIWNDQGLEIVWPLWKVNKVIVSERDSKWPTIDQLFLV